MEIENYPNYLIYEDGKVWSKNRNNYVTQWENKKHYKVVFLYNNGEKKLLKVYRLVALHYIKNTHPNIYKEVDHIDRDKTNNHKDNLRWVSCSYNCMNKENNITSNIQCVSLDGKSWRYNKMVKGVRLRRSFKNKQLCLWFKFVYELNLNKKK